MAHVAKFKAGNKGLGHHYDREETSEEHSHSNPRIDPARSHLNYRIYDENLHTEEWAKQPFQSCLNERLGVLEKTPRKDAVVFATVVVTAPKDLKAEDEARFFRCVYTTIGGMIGQSNMLPGYIHNDETTPHGHFPFTPITADNRLNFKKVCPRSFYSKLHKELGKAVDKELGYHVSIELGEDQALEKCLSNVPQAKLDAARDALVEKLEKENAALISENQRLQGDIEVKDMAISCAEARIYELDKSIEKASERAVEADLRADKAEALATTLEAENGALRAEIGGLERQRDALKENLEKARQEHTQEMSRMLSRERELEGKIDGLEREVSRLERIIEGFEEKVQRIYASAVDKMNSFAQQVGDFFGAFKPHWLTQTIDRNETESALRSLAGNPYAQTCLEKSRGFARGPKFAERGYNAATRTIARDARKLERETQKAAPGIAQQLERARAASLEQHEARMQERQQRSQQQTKNADRGAR